LTHIYKYICINILCRDIPLVVLDCANIGWSYGKYDDDNYDDGDNNDKDSINYIDYDDYELRRY